MSEKQQKETANKEKNGKERSGWERHKKMALPVKSRQVLHVSAVHISQFLIVTQFYRLFALTHIIN